MRSPDAATVAAERISFETVCRKSGQGPTCQLAAKMRVEAVFFRAAIDVQLPYAAAAGEGRQRFKCALPPRRRVRVAAGGNKKLLR